MPWSTGGCSTTKKNSFLLSQQAVRYSGPTDGCINTCGWQTGTYLFIAGHIRKQEAPTKGQKLQKYLRITPGYHLCFVCRNVSRYYHKYLFTTQNGSKVHSLCRGPRHPLSGQKIQSISRNKIFSALFKRTGL
jgi:hypothetical protein